MIKIIVIILMIIIGAIIFYTYSGEPSIEIIPRSYDFGNIPSEIVEHTFTVRNTGAAVLKIDRVSTSCGCTSASIDSENIEPGRTANLLVTFDPNAMEGGVQGEVLRIIYIKSNDPEKPEIEVEITANVV